MQQACIQPSPMSSTCSTPLSSSFSPSSRPCSATALFCTMVAAGRRQAFVLLAILKVCVCGCVWVCVALTEVSQAGQRSSLQLGVVGEPLTGSERHTLNAVVYQDVVVTFCQVTPIKHTLALDPLRGQIQTRLL